MPLAELEAVSGPSSIEEISVATSEDEAPVTLPVKEVSALQPST
jgi:hypothetical protein